MSKIIDFYKGDEFIEKIDSDDTQYGYQDLMSMSHRFIFKCGGKNKELDMKCDCRMTVCTNSNKTIWFKPFGRHFEHIDGCDRATENQKITKKSKDKLKEFLNDLLLGILTPKTDKETKEIIPIEKKTKSKGYTFTDLTDLKTLVRSIVNDELDLDYAIGNGNALFDIFEYERARILDFAGSSNGNYKICIFDEATTTKTGNIVVSYRGTDKLFHNIYINTLRDVEYKVLHQDVSVVAVLRGTDFTATSNNFSSITLNASRYFVLKRNKNGNLNTIERLIKKINDD